MADETLNIHDTGQGQRTEGPGSRIGPYTLLRLVGEGGFGDVYEAEQIEPVKRRVALKIIKLGMDTREVIGRFDIERQSLAMMEHPHIARVIDAGTTNSGRPYFVMEFVDGVPITEYCAAKALPVDAVLRLFEQVCAAVQHAHTKGVIHRDLKPGNVLVGTQDGRPYAKVIDFGIAKATGGDRRERTLATQMHQVIGTPLYMSPEQALGSPDIDIRTDIYSLGVILYELLTGTTPVEREKLLAVSLVDTQKLICETEPPRPSARVLHAATTLTGTATFRPADPRKLARTLRGELDWIVMKALEKEPARRYQSALDFADDLRSYLGGDAVQAAPPAIGYRLHKFIRRNKTVVAAGSLVALSLLVGIVAFAWQAKIASQRATELEQVTAFESDMFHQINPADAGERLAADVRAKFDASLREAGIADAERDQRLQRFDEDWKQINATDAARDVIDQNVLQPAAQSIVEKFEQQPLVAAQLRESLADRYDEMGLIDAAIALESRALDDRRRTLGEDAPETIHSEFRMGSLSQSRGLFAQAESYYKTVLAALRKHGMDNSRDALIVTSNLGVIYAESGRYALAEDYYRRVLDGARRLLGNDSPETVLASQNIGALLRSERKYDQAEPYLREAAAAQAKASGPNAEITLYAYGNLALLAEARGQLDQADHLIADVVERCRKTYGETHPTTLLATIVMGGVEEREGKHEQTERLLAPIESAARKELTGDYAFWYGSLRSHLGRARLALGRYAEAETDLLVAEPILAAPHVAQEPDDLLDCTRALVALYTAWERADPGKGHAATAGKWRLKLDALEHASGAPAKPQSRDRTSPW